MDCLSMQLGHFVTSINVKKAFTMVFSIQHVQPFYAPILANLYRRYSAIELTAEELKLVANALIFHDAGRMGEDCDYWDKDSEYYFIHI